MKGVQFFVSKRNFLASQLQNVPIRFAHSARLCSGCSKLNSMFYFVTLPKWLRFLYGNYIWDLPAAEKVVYLSFDDGPNEVETNFVLDTLQEFNAKGTFFCIGKNVAGNHSLFNRICREGHSVGSHTWSHLDGWKTNTDIYLKDVEAAATLTGSRLFRPPYGRLTRKQAQKLRDKGMNIIMWSITSGDYDKNTSPQRCLKNMVQPVYPGAIILMHDSRQAAALVRYALPRMLQQLAEAGYRFAAIEDKSF